MTKISTGLLSGILVTIIMLTSGTTYYLEKTGDYKTCNVGGWALDEKTGQYDCKDRGITEWCSELSAINKDNIQTRCYISRVILTEPDVGDYAEKIEGDELIVQDGINNNKIEKVKLEDDTYQYNIYKLSEITTDKKIVKDIEKLNKEIVKLQDENNFLDEYYEACMYICPDINTKLIEELKMDTRMFCEADCDTERTDHQFYLETHIKLNEDKIKELELIG